MEGSVLHVSALPATLFPARAGEARVRGGGHQCTALSRPPSVALPGIRKLWPPQTSDWDPIFPVQATAHLDTSAFDHRGSAQVEATAVRATMLSLEP